MQSKMLLFHVGSFDLKTSRVQECGSMDMSKFGHSQTGKIKSKHKFGFFFTFFIYIGKVACLITLEPFFFLPWTQTHILKFDHQICLFCRSTIYRSHTLVGHTVTFEADNVHNNCHMLNIFVLK